jgi:hypothetical protein
VIREITGQAAFAEYLGHFDHLIGDKRTGRTFGEIVQGIINAGSRVCQSNGASDAQGSQLVRDPS